MDGKHIRIVPPAHSGSTFYNFKGTYSVVMLAIIDHNYEIIYIDVGTEGKNADGGIWRQCSFKEYLDDGDLDLPRPKKLPGTNKIVPHVIVSDDAFPLGPHIMKPFNRRLLTRKERIFNYRLSRAIRVAENAFGILANRFRLFLTNICLHPDRVVSVTLAAAALHNMLRRKCGKNYIPPGSIDQEDIDHGIIPGEWRAQDQLPAIPPARGQNQSIMAKKIRHDLKDFFVSPRGRVDWQNDAISF